VDQSGLDLNSRRLTRVFWLIWAVRVKIKLLNRINANSLSIPF